MITNITGTLLDGRPIAPGVPADRRRPLDLYQRNDASLVCRVQDSQGSLVRVSTITSARLSIQTLRTGAGVLLAKTGALDTIANTITFTIADTELTDSKFPPGTYLYEVMAILASGAREILIPASALRIFATVSAA